MESGFTGGLNSIDSPFTIADGETRDCLNVFATTRGSIQKRTGMTQFLQDPPNLEFSSIFPVTISGTKWLIGFAGTHIYKIDVAGVYTAITGAATVTSGSRWSVVQSALSAAVASEGPVYMVNGVDPPLFWSGSGNVAAWTGDTGGYAASPHVPNGPYMIYAANRIWIGGVAASPATVYFSDLVSTGPTGGLPDPSSFPIPNTIGFDVEDAQPITGLGTIGPYVLVFKENKTWVIINPGNPSGTRQVSNTLGCVAHRSIVETPEGTFFLTDNDGVYLTTGTKMVEMSYKVRPTVLQINQSVRGQACGAFHANHYYLSYPSGSSTSNNRTLDYDLQLKAWWLHDMTVNQYALFEPSGAPSLYAAVPGGLGTFPGVQQCFTAGVYLDYGQVYTGANGYSAYYYGAWQDFYEYFLRHRIRIPMVKKRVRQITFGGSGVIIPLIFKNFETSGTQYAGVAGNASEAVPTLPIDFAAGGELWGDATQVWGDPGLPWGGTTASGIARIYAPGVANEWSVAFGNSDENPFEVSYYTYAISTRKS